MIKKNVYPVIPILILLFLLSSCLLAPPLNTSSLKGKVLVPDGTAITKDISGEALPNAIVNVIDPTTSTVIATTTTDADGNYQVLVPPGGPYLLEVTKGDILICQITPEVEVGEEYDLGTTDCLTTTIALIAQAMRIAEDYPDDFTEMNLTAIETDPDFSAIMMLICNAIQSGLDPTQSPDITQAIEDFLHPPEPAPTPTTTPTYTISATAGIGGSIDPEGSINIKKGNNHSFTITADTGYQIFDVLVDGTSVGVVSTYTFTNVQQDHTIEASFVQVYTLTLSADPAAGGTVSDITDTGPYPSGTVVNISALPEIGYEFDYWSTTSTGAFDDATSAATEFTMPGEDSLITAHFVYTEYTLTMAVSGSGSTEPLAGDHVFPARTVVDITATPTGDCSLFINWSDEVTNPESASTTVTVDADKTVTAHFGKAYISGTLNEYTSIQDAIDAATDSQTVIVCPGTYYENLEFDGKNITVQSTDPSDSTVIASTIIDGGGIGEVVTFLGGDTSNLEGFTIQNGNANSGAGIYVFSSTPIIRYNTIKNNTADFGGGIALLNNSQATITHNIIRDNTGTGSGGGLYVNNSFPSITHNTIQDNTSGFGGGGIYLYEYCNSTISNNTISGNQASDNGGGISVHHYSNPYIGSNIIAGNTATKEGGGIHVSHYCDPTLNLNNISNNSTTGTSGYGGGIFIESSSAPTISQNAVQANSAKYGSGILVKDNTPSSLYYISGNTIENNTGASQGGGICIFNSNNLSISPNNVITNNSAIAGGGILVWESSLTISGNTIYENTATLHGGGVDVGGASSITIENNDINTNDATGSTNGGYGGGIYLDNLFASVTIISNEIKNNLANVVGDQGSGGGIHVKSGAANTPTIGGTGNYNTICGNSPNQIDPNSFPDNYICDTCPCPSP